ncbi:uncharacterized protein J4E88_009961 [Alternaria novae-zelandiae]|uniref:uncharacterized protein n=1 Tax=Alternaria novae-zelandiae TaxID=430562 RepID=UPI0020C42496|nr:uncharacterized protein J4E88_009961 [Alternaria novae-zelandiae]KAI4669679.1 hypothetical protein J4E88_009961 [Alternaria novae-zelandiae]
MSTKTSFTATYQPVTQLHNDSALHSMAQLTRPNPDSFYEDNPSDSYDDPQEEEYHDYLRDASAWLEDYRGRAEFLAYVPKLTGKFKFATSTECDTFSAADRSLSNILARLPSEVDERIMIQEGPYRRAFFLKIRDRLPKELREMVFGYIFQGTYVLLEANRSEADSEDDTLPCVEQDIGRHYPYSYLLKPGYIHDLAIRTELIEAWFRTSNFIVTDAALIRRSLEKYPWSAGIEPLQLIRRVELKAKPLEAPLMREAICKDLDSLKCLNPGTTIIIIVKRFPERSHHPREDLHRAESLYPVALRMRGMGYKMIVRPYMNDQRVVERGNRWVEAWLRENE